MAVLRPTHFRKPRLQIGVALALLAWLALPAAPSNAATFTVTKTTDTNDGNCNADCSLREAVVAANAAGGADTIEIPAGYYKLTIVGDDDTAAEGDLDISSEITLKAMGAVTVDGGGIDRVLDVLGLGTAKLLGMRITGGLAVEGGGIQNFGIMTITNSTVSGNDATLSGGGISNNASVDLTNSTVSGNDAPFGGGIYNTDVNGTVTLINSTVSGNSASQDGGGIYNFGTEVTLTNSTVSDNRAQDGGGIHNSVTVDLTNSTVSGNKAAVSGGGIYSATGVTTITGSTVTDNQADTDGNDFGDGGGIRNDGTLTIGNSIVAGNVDGPTTTHPDCSGAITSDGHNIIESTTGCTVTLQANDDTGAVALGPLAFNGGATETHALPAGSAAVNHGPTIGTGVDQRGVLRPVGAAFDTGAYEQVFCSGLLVNVVGTNGKDTLRGTARADGVLAQGGNDTVRSGDNNDKVCGGKGNDELFGEKGNDKLLGEDGNDLLDGGPGTDVCVGGPGTNKLKSC